MFSLPAGEVMISVLIVTFLGLGVPELCLTLSGNSTLDCVIGATGSFKALRTGGTYLPCRYDGVLVMEARLPFMGQLFGVTLRVSIDLVTSTMFLRRVNNEQHMKVTYQRTLETQKWKA